MPSSMRRVVPRRTLLYEVVAQALETFFERRLLGVTMHQLRHGCGNETKLAYGSSPVEFGGGLWLPGGIVIAIAPSDFICGIARRTECRREIIN